MHCHVSVDRYSKVARQQDLHSVRKNDDKVYKLGFNFQKAFDPILLKVGIFY